MLKISLAADVEYYLDKNLQGSSEIFGAVQLDKLADEAEAGSFDIPYYNSSLNNDPLARPGRWSGKFAEELGLANGSFVEAKQFALLYYGYDPQGKGPLSENIPSIKEQRNATAAANAADEYIVKIKKQMAERSKLLKKKGIATSEFPKDKKWNQLVKRLEDAKTRRKLISSQVGKRQPAHDLTFNAPKPASMLIMKLLHEGKTDEAKKIEEAWNKACEAVVNDVENDFIKVRPRNEKSERRIESVKGMACAMFNHFDARPVGSNDPDPHLHTHAILFAPVKAWDDTVMAAWTAHINTNAPMLGTKARALFAQELSALGYEILADEREKIVSFEIAGISKEQSKNFENRTAQINKHIDDGIGDHDARKLDRGFKTMSGEDFLASAGSRMEAVGFQTDNCKNINLETLIRKQIREQMEIEKSNGLISYEPNSKEWTASEDKRFDAAMQPYLAAHQFNSPSEIIDKLTEINPHFTVHDLELMLWQRMQTAKIDLKEGEDAAQAAARIVGEMSKTILSSADICVVDGLDQIGQAKFTSKKQRQAEQDFYGSLLPKMLTQDAGLGLSKEIADKYIAEAEARKGFKYSEKQKDAVRFLVGGSQQISCICAWAGSGKTAAAECAVNSWKSQGFKVLAMAPSNAAAENLRAEIGASEHYTPERLAIQMTNGKVSLDNKTVLYIDEASMLDFRETKILLEQAVAAGSKVVFCGDPAQLPSVGLGNVLRKIVEDTEYKSSVFHITDSFESASQLQRQKAYWQKQGTALLSLGHTARAIEEYDKRGFVRKHNFGEDMLEAACSDYTNGLEPLAKKLQEARARLEEKSKLPAFMKTNEKEEYAALTEQMRKLYSNKALLATTNEVVNKLNHSVRDTLKKSGALSDNEIEISREDGKSLNVAIGERLVFDAKLKSTSAKSNALKDEGQIVGKAQIGTVVGFKTAKDGQKQLLIAIDNSEVVKKDGSKEQKIVTVDPRLFSDFSYAYALTAHKAQGISIDEAYFVATPDSSNKNVFISSETALVAMTRHKKKLVIHTLEDSYQQFITNASKITAKVEANDLFQSYIDAAPENGKLEILERGPNGFGQDEALLEAAARLDTQLEQPEQQQDEENSNGRATPDRTTTATTERADTPAATGYIPRFKSSYQPRFDNPRSQSSTWSQTRQGDGLFYMPSSGMADNEPRESEMLLYGDETNNIRSEGSGSSRAALLTQPIIDSTPLNSNRGNGRVVTESDRQLEQIRYLEAFLPSLKREQPLEPNTSYNDIISKLRTSFIDDERSADLEQILALGIAKGKAATEADIKNYQWLGFDEKSAFGINDKTGQIEGFDLSTLSPELITNAKRTAVHFGGDLSKITIAQEVPAEQFIEAKSPKFKGELLAFGLKPMPSKDGAEPAAEAPKVPFVKILLADGKEADFFYKDLYETISKSSFTIGDEIEFAKSGITTVSISQPQFENGKLVGHTKQEFNKTIFEVNSAPVPEHGFDLKTRRNIVGLAHSAFAGKKLQTALGLNAEQAKQIFNHSSVVGINQIDADLGLEAYKHGVYNEQTDSYKLHLVPIAEHEGKLICSTPFDGAEMQGQPLGANVSKLFVIDKQLAGDVKIGSGFTYTQQSSSNEPKIEACNSKLDELKDRYKPTDLSTAMDRIPHIAHNGKTCGYLKGTLIGVSENSYFLELNDSKHPGSVVKIAATQEISKLNREAISSRVVGKPIKFFMAQQEEGGDWTTLQSNVGEVLKQSNAPAPTKNNSHQRRL